MNDTRITFQGWLGDEVEVRHVGQATVAKFRVGSTPRRFNRQQNSWVDEETIWYTVNAWRTLGENCAQSLRKGDPVVVHGRLTCQVWQDDQGLTRQTYIVEATHVGHDLSKGTASFVRRKFSDGADDSELRAANAEAGVVGPQISSDGETLEDMVEPLPREDAAVA